MRNLIDRIEKRSPSQGFTQECAVAFAVGWFETLVDLNGEKSYTVKEVLDLLVCLDGIRNVPDNRKQKEADRIESTQ